LEVKEFHKQGPERLNSIYFLDEKFEIEEEDEDFRIGGDEATEAVDQQKEPEEPTEFTLQ